MLQLNENYRTVTSSRLEGNETISILKYFVITFYVIISLIQSK